MKLPKWLRQVVKDIREGDVGFQDSEVPWTPTGTFTRPDLAMTEEEVAKLKADFAEARKRHDPPVALSDRPPAFSPRHTYGGKGTIHQTSAIDVEVDQGGRVLAVWFRCMSLPFQVYLRKGIEQSIGVINPTGIAIEEITYVDLPSEESSQ